MDYRYLVAKGGNSNKPFVITIQNHPETPWLDWIEKGIKKYEGRLNRGIFAKLKIGDIVVWKDRYKQVKTKVVDMKYYDDFGLAFNDLGKELIPIEGMNEHGVRQLYSKYFTQKDIRENGVVAIKLKVIH